LLVRPIIITAKVVDLLDAAHFVSVGVFVVVEVIATIGRSSLTVRTVIAVVVIVVFETT
jgi:hypothetical protein